jgi:hypothetical protein
MMKLCNPDQDSTKYLSEVLDGDFLVRQTYVNLLKPCSPDQDAIMPFHLPMLEAVHPRQRSQEAIPPAVKEGLD